MKLTSSYRIILVAMAFAATGMTTGCGRGSGLASLDRGMAELRLGNHGTAAQLLERAVASLPDNASARCNLGIAYWKTGRPNEAIAALKQAAELDQMSPTSLEFLSQVFVEKEDWSEASKALAEAAERAPASARIMTARGVLALHADDVNQAYDFLMQAEEAESEYQPALYNLAVLYRDRVRNPKQARRYFGRFLDAVERASTHDGAALSGSDLRRVEAARRFVASEESGQPRLASPLVEAARAAIAEERFTEAIILLKDAVTKDPRDPDALWELATFYQKHLGDPGEAATLYKRFQQLFPGDARALQVADGVIPEAPPPAPEPEEEPEPAATPENGAAEGGGDAARDARSMAAELWQRGVERHDDKDYEGAISLFKQALQMDPKCYQASYSLGLAYMDQKLYEKARDAFQETLEIKSDVSKARCLLGRMYTFLGDSRKAVEELNRVLRQEPDNAQANYYVAAVYLKEKQIEMGRTHLQQCVNVQPGGYYGRRAAKLLVQLQSVRKPPLPSSARP